MAAHYASRLLYTRALLSADMLGVFDAFWVRDLYLGAALREHYRDVPMCVEVHQEPSARQASYMLRADSPKTLWGPIGPATQRATLSVLGPLRSGDMVQLPMAAPKDFFEASPANAAEELLEVDAPAVRIAYVGSYRSGGHDQGVRELAETVLGANFASPAELLIVGVGEVGVRDLGHLRVPIQPGNSLNVVPYVEHSRVPALMQSSDVLTLPYPGGRAFFDGRFPMKLVEYAASRKPIVLTSTPSHTSVFPLDAGYFYEFGNATQLVNQLHAALGGGSDRDAKVQRAFEWAQRHTYAERVRPAINWINDRLDVDTR